MKKLDWYILKKFLGTFFYAIMIFMIISVVIDATEKIDNFIDNHLSLKYIIFKYYIGFIPHIIALLFPLFIFIAVIFFTSKMAYRSEIIAILGNGVGFGRFLRPYWVGSILLALLLGISNQWLIPDANKIRTSFENKYVNKLDPTSVLSNIHMRVDSQSYISMFVYYPTDQYAAGFTLEKIQGQQLLFKLETQTLSYDSAHQAWRTSVGVVRRLVGLKQDVHMVNDTLLKMNLTPQDLLNRTDAIQALTTPELDHFISRQKLRGAEGLNYLYVEKYRRTASAFAVIILTFIGAVIASRKVRGGSGLHLALGIIISSLYILFMQFSTTFSIKGNLNPLLSVWIPNIVFAGVALLLYRRAPK